VAVRITAQSKGLTEVLMGKNVLPIVLPMMEVNSLI